MERAIAVAIAWILDGVRKPTFRLLASGKAGGAFPRHKLVIRPQTSSLRRHAFIGLLNALLWGDYDVAPLYNPWAICPCSKTKKTSEQI